MAASDFVPFMVRRHVGMNGIYGSTKISQWLRDARDGVDGIDFVWVGDSTIVNPSNSGYQLAMMTALQNLGIPLNSTPIIPGLINSGALTTTSGGSGQGVKTSSYATGTAGQSPSTGSVYSLTARVTATDAPAVELAAYLGYDASILPKMLAGSAWDGAYIKTGETYTSGASGNYIKLFQSNPLIGGAGPAGSTLSYVVGYGKFSQTGGSFKIRPMTGTNTLISGTGNTGSLSTAGGSSVATAEYKFTSPSSGAGTAPLQVNCSWDGWNTSNPVTGPACILWHSVIQRGLKGCGSSVLVGDGGKTTAQLADRIEALHGGLTEGVANDGMFLAEYLKHCAFRQTATGGTGRVCVVITSGQNEAASVGVDGEDYVEAAQRIVAAMYHAWVEQLEYDETDLCLMFVPSHPRSTTEYSAAEPRMDLIRAAAKDWGLSGCRLADDTQPLNGCVVASLGDMTTYDELLARNMYSFNTAGPTYASETAHLRPTDLRTLTASGLYPNEIYSVLTPNDGYQFCLTKILRELLK